MKNQVIKGDSVRKNFIYQFLYQFIILVIPLIVSPYLTRVLGSQALGIYTFTYSIAYYFVICAMLGISKHGQRVVAERKSAMVKLRKTVWSLITFHVIISVIVFGIYMIYAVFLCRNNKEVVFAQGIYVFSAIVDFSWVFQGLEKFKTVVIRNTIVKLVECLLIFGMVKTPDDLLVYTIIMSFSVCLGHVVVLPQIISLIRPVKFSWKDFKEHFKPMIVLFVAAIAATLYTVFDKTLLGILSDMENVAFYEYSNKIVTIPRTFIVVISTVLFPKACKMVSSGDIKGMKKILDNSLMINYFIGFASIWGLLGVGDLFAKTYYGTQFLECGEVIMSMSPLILIIGLGEVLRSQYLFPLRKDKIMVVILFINAIINLAISTALIPNMGVYGAVIGTIVAEVFGLAFELFLCRKYLKISAFFAAGIPFCIIGFVMYGSIKIVALFAKSNIAGLLMQILIGAFIYILLALIYINYTNNEISQTIKRAIIKVKGDVHES